MQEKPLTSEDIKKALIKESERRWNALFVIDEFEQYSDIIGGNRADIYLVKKNRLSVEIEVKVNKNDLVNLEPRKTKWSCKYHEDEKLQQNGIVPNYFYFAMPTELWEQNKEFIEEHWPFAGVLGCCRSYFTDTGEQYTLSSFKKCRRIHKHPVPNKIVDRMCQLFYYRWKKLRLKITQ